MELRRKPLRISSEKFFRFVQLSDQKAISGLTISFQSYGYEYLPLLLALAQPSLAVLLPNPLPPSIPASTKYPFSLVRKSLRLLLDDNPEALEEVENDIGFVYSGWAPISIRLVQCVAQKGGVISNPAEKEKTSDEQSKSSIGKVQAHPIVGWRGFEDIVSAIPGETVAVEAVRRHDDGIGPALTPMSASCKSFFQALLSNSF